MGPLLCETADLTAETAAVNRDTGGLRLRFGQLTQLCGAGLAHPAITATTVEVTRAHTDIVQQLMRQDPFPPYHARQTPINLGKNSIVAGWQGLVNRL